MNRGNVFTVSAINQYIKMMFQKDQALAVVFVKGEKEEIGSLLETLHVMLSCVYMCVLYVCICVFICMCMYVYYMYVCM